MFKIFSIKAIFLITVIFFGGCSGENIKLQFKDEIDENKEIKNNQENESIEKIGDFFQGKTIQDLLNQNKNLKCTWRIEKAEISADADVEDIDEEDSGGTEEGKIYFKEGQFFQEIQITENSRKTFIKTLKKDEYFYQWNSLAVNQGLKMSFEKAKYSEFLKIDKIYNWNCQEFFNHDYIFQIPDNIEFFNF